MSNWFTRRRRIMGRVLNKKELPQYTYRFDTRAPSVIRALGFQPWANAGTISVIEHVKNSYASGAKAGQQTKHDSQWVSTGAYGLVKKLDPTFAQQVLSTNLYRIDTTLALATGNFFDANDTFDRAGIDRPYATQREWIKVGGVPQSAILHCMTGRAFFDQYDFSTGAPEEHLLTGWTTF